MAALIALTVVCVLSYTFEIIFGLAGTIMMLAVMTLVYDSKTLVIYSLLPQILVGSIGLLRSPKTVDLSFLAGMLLFAAAGGFAGLWLFYYFSPQIFQFLLAVTITVFGAYLVLAPGRLKLNRPIAHGLDTLAGASQALFGISGPIAMTRLLSTFSQKTIVRNYALAFFLSMNVFRATAYVIKGTITAEVEQMMLVSGPFIAAALWFSNHLHFRVNETLFRRVVAWMILVGGATLFYR